MAKTYDDLKEDVLNWCFIRLEDNARANVEAAIPVAIRSGEELLYHDVKLLAPEMLVTYQEQLPSLKGSFVIPSDCLRVMKFRLAGGESDVLRKTSRQMVRQVNNRTIKPADRMPVWAIDSKLIYIAPAAEAPTDYAIDYFAEPPFMTAAGTEPAFFDRYYSLYFAAAKWGLYRFLGQYDQAEREYQAVSQQAKQITDMALLRYGAAGG